MRESPLCTLTSASQRTGFSAANSHRPVATGKTAVTPTPRHRLGQWATLAPHSGDEDEEGARTSVSCSVTRAGRGERLRGRSPRARSRLARHSQSLVHVPWFKTYNADSERPGPTRGLGRNPRRGQPTTPDALTPPGALRPGASRQGHPAGQVECPCVPSTLKATAGSHEQPSGTGPRRSTAFPVTHTATSLCPAAACPWPVVSTKSPESAPYVGGEGQCLLLPTNGNQFSPPRASTRSSECLVGCRVGREKSSNVWGCP